LDFIDIVLVSFLIYQIYKLVKGTAAIKILLGVGALYLIWKLVEALDMQLLSEILGQFIGVGVIALIVVFQQEIRKFLLMIGNTSFRNRKEFLLGISQKEASRKKFYMELILEAVEKLSKTKTGSLIVLQRESDLSFIRGSGKELDATISSALIESIFFKNSPLHDGAAVIANNRILSASCILPVSERQDLPFGYGMRHRAGLGLTESTDAVVIIVSEERGSISFCHDGKLKYNISLDNLRKLIL